MENQSTELADSSHESPRPAQGQGVPWHGKKPKLSAEMQKAVDYAQAHGGKIVRYPGGFWAKGGVWTHNERSFGTTTIQALISRGVAKYTDWQYRKDGSRFPIEITVNIPEAGSGDNNAAI